MKDLNLLGFILPCALQFWICLLQFYNHQIIGNPNSSFLRCGWLNRIFFWKIQGWRWCRTFLSAGGPGAVFLGCSFVFWFLCKPCFQRRKTVIPCDTNTKSLLVVPGRCSLGDINPHLFSKVGNCFEETWLLLSCPCQGCIWESQVIFFGHCCSFCYVVVVLLLALVLVVAMFVAAMKGFLRYIDVW